MPSRPFGATAVDIRRFSRRNLSTSGYSAAEKRLSRWGARISVSLCEQRLCGFGRCAGRRERGEVDGGGFAREKFCHDMRGGGSEEDAIAVVSGGDEMA